MKKYLLFSSLFFFTGCSYFSVTTSNCEQLMLNDPNAQNIPQECRDYNAEEAEKASYPPGQKPVEIDKEFQLGK